MLYKCWYAAVSPFSVKLRWDNTPKVQQGRFMLKFRQTVWSPRSSNMLLSRAGLAPQTGLESFPRFRVIRQVSRDGTATASTVLWEHLTGSTKKAYGILSTSDLTWKGGWQPWQVFVRMGAQMFPFASCKWETAVSFLCQTAGEFIFLLKTECFSSRGINKVRNQVSYWEWCM